MLPRKRSRQCSRFAGSQEGGVVSCLDRPNGVPSYLAPPRPAAPPCAAQNQTTGRPVFGFNLSNPKPGHTTGGSGRGARRSGQAGSGKIGCQRNHSPRKQKSTVLSKIHPLHPLHPFGIGFTRFHSTNSTTAFLAPLSPQTKSNSLNIPLQARTKEFLCKPAEEQNPRLTTGLPPVYQRFITGTKSALRSWMPTSRSTPFCLCKPFSSQGCPGTVK